MYLSFSSSSSSKQKRQNSLLLGNWDWEHQKTKSAMIRNQELGIIFGPKRDDNRRFSFYPLFQKNWLAFEMRCHGGKLFQKFPSFSVFQVGCNEPIDEHGLNSSWAKMDSWSSLTQFWMGFKMDEKREILSLSFSLKVAHLHLR